MSTDTRITTFYVHHSLAERAAWLIEHGWTQRDGSFWWHPRIDPWTATMPEAVACELGDDGI